MNRTEERYKRKERYDTREQKRDNGWKHGRSHGLLLFHGSGGHLSHYAFVAYGGGSRRVGSKGKEEYFWQTGETDGDAVGGGSGRYAPRKSSGWSSVNDLHLIPGSFADDPQSL